MAGQDRLSASGQAEYGSRTAAGGMGITREPENQWEAAGPTQLLWAGPGAGPLERPPPSPSHSANLSVDLRASMSRLSKQTVQSKAVMKEAASFQKKALGGTMTASCGYGVTKASSPGAFVGTGKINRGQSGNPRRRRRCGPESVTIFLHRLTGGMSRPRQVREAPPPILPHPN